MTANSTTVRADMPAIIVRSEIANSLQLLQSMTPELNKKPNWFIKIFLLIPNLSATLLAPLKQAAILFIFCNTSSD